MWKSKGYSHLNDKSLDLAQWSTDARHDTGSGDDCGYVRSKIADTGVKDKAVDRLTEDPELQKGSHNEEATKNGQEG